MRTILTNSKNIHFFVLFTIIIILFSAVIVFINPILAQEKQLSITIEGHIVKSNEPFTVIVKDENNMPVMGASVGIQSIVGQTKITDEDGIALLTAPGDYNQITIVAQKEGYKEGKKTVEIYVPPGPIETLLQNQYTPIVFAVIAVISAILIVNFRQKRHRKTVVGETPKEQPIQNCSAHGVVVSISSDKKNANQRLDKDIPTEEIRMDSKSGPKVEEIRISRPRKDKEIVSVKTEEESIEKIPAHKTKRKHEYDWFEGEDDVRYKIDKITGEIDEEGVDKWFEGIDDVRSKIDEKIKKKDKKKR